MFRDFRFFIFKKGIGSIQLNIITKKIIENNGIIHQSPSLETTHFIISENESILLIPDDLKDKISIRNIRVYTLDWITQSILNKKKIVDDIIYQRPFRFRSSLNDDILIKENNSNINVNNNNNNKRSLNNVNNNQREKKCKFNDSNNNINSNQNNISWLSYDSDEDLDVSLNYNINLSFNNNNINSHINNNDKEKDIEISLSETFMFDDSTDKSIWFNYNSDSSDSDNNEDHKNSNNKSLIFDSPFSSQLPLALSPIKLKNNDHSNNNNDSPIKSLVKNSNYKNFVCQSTKINYNEHLTSVLVKLQTKAEADGDNWRQYAYKRAIGILRNLTFKVTSDKQVGHIKGIGSKISDKIKEILLTGTLKKVEMVQSDAHTIASEQLSKIHGTGPETVKRWLAKGINSIQKLQVIANNDPSFLTNQQQIGLKYYNDFQHRIPREEVQDIANIVQLVANEIDQKIIMQVCGSFRRNKSTCGDIDILFTHSKGELLTGFLGRLVQKLVDCKLLTDHLTNLNTNSDKYMGVCRLDENSRHRRIDFQSIVREEWPFALLYFTGSDHFNRSMRLWARKNGFSLSESHLVRRWGTAQDEIKGEPIPAANERDIFQLLGLEYKEPHQREI
ncbi:hypothetical protein PPL_00073 [Heterostelium album PN500]|uniref:DNA polymerase n=1 Tax=Heterostelium pallidum (strain ATCC 26659 / Pp 5 / PN500) TaxID=670386 RepID=D3AVG3_HETP5|nr:hypothetical protein PPL_00073 [Heterostelium album PN500]EFA86286.1 hypothetical protein PPL_00073 [Heterostelium album PN500]|eukprot:XP_020438391.1 hypothetical protein PPL_00073 [Heterostelium album PN500]